MNNKAIVAPINAIKVDISGICKDYSAHKSDSPTIDIYGTATHSWRDRSG